MLPLIFFPEPIQNTTITITFEDESPTLYMDKGFAKKIEIIDASLTHQMQESATQTFKCHVCSSKIFQTIFAIASENQSLNLALTQEQKQDPWIFEELTSSLSFFYPKQVEEISENILNELSHTLSIENAQKIANIEVKTRSPLVVFAQKRVKAAIYFPNEKQADAFSNKINCCLQSYLKAKCEYDLESDPSKKESILSDLEKLNLQLEAYQEELKKIKHSPEGQYFASQFVDDPNSFLRIQGLKAKKNLKTYCDAITNALRDSGADMSRKDLLDYIVGPKGYLFSYLGIVPLKDSKNLKKPFRFVPVLRATCISEKRPHVAPKEPLGFDLNNPTPRDLEEKIRKELSESIFSQFIKYKHRPPHKFLISIDPSSLNQGELIQPQSETVGIKDNELEPLFEDHANLPNGSLICNLLHHCLSLEKAFEILNEEKNQVFSSAISLLAHQKINNCIYFPNFEEASLWFERYPDLKQFKKQKLSPLGKSHAAKYIEDPNIKIRMSALKAQKIFKVYCAAIHTALEKTHPGCTKRTDLMENITGLRFLFSHYGLVPGKKIHKARFSFRFLPGAMGTCVYKKKLHLTCDSVFGYSLENLSPKALEIEIRDDIEGQIKKTDFFLIEKLPPILIEDDEITSPITKELEVLRNMLIPKIADWHSLSQEERNPILKLLIELNKWDQYGIEPAQITLKKLKNIGSLKACGSPLIIKAILTFKSVMYSIYFNTHDCLLLLKNKSQRIPDTFSTHDFLKALFEKSNSAK